MSLPVIWFLVAVACFVLEMLTPGFVCMFFGVGALAAAAISVWYPSVTVGLGAFCAVSLVSVVFLRSRVMRAMQGWSKSPRNIVEQGTPATQVGRNGMITQALGPGCVGEVELGGSFWRAVAEDALSVGTPVEVYATDPHDELLLNVRRLPGTLEQKNPLP